MTEPRNFENWAKPIEVFHVEETVERAHRGNVEVENRPGRCKGSGSYGRRPMRWPSPVRPTPEQVIQTWKERFGDFWYPSNKFYAPAAGIAPGEIAVIAGGGARRR